MFLYTLQANAHQKGLPCYEMAKIIFIVVSHISYHKVTEMF